MKNGSLRVLRGGGWDDVASSWVRAASRDSDVPALRDSLLGFRVARRAGP